MKRSTPNGTTPRPVSRHTIDEHEGKKYLREIYPARVGDTLIGGPIDIDVYCVLKAFKVTCPAIAHCIKKLLCAGLRDKGSYREDLHGAMAALNRAIDMEEEGK